MKTNLNKVMVAGLFAIALSSAVFAQNACEVLNQIIDSGLDHQNSFAAIAGVRLPNADECEVEFGDHDDKWNSFACSWNEKNDAILEKMELEEEELFDAYLDHDGGRDAWDEAEEFIDKSNYWVRTYNEAIKTPPRSQQALDYLNSFAVKSKKYLRKSRAKEEEAIALDRERDEAEAKYDAKKAEVEKFEEELEKSSDRQVSDLYTGLYACFSKEAIRNAEAYMVDPQAKSWTQDGGCNINIDSGPTLSVYCPNPNYQSQ